MRTVIILLFTCVFISVAETGHSQNAKVTLNKNKVALKEVLNEIENQTDYLFIYNNEVNTNKTVSVKTKNGTVRKVLNHVLKDSDIDFLMEGNHIILSYIEEKLKERDEEVVEAVQQQGKTVTGRVTDLNGESLPGVTVLIKGTSKGTVTDVDGNFTLTDISENEILQFSFVGMSTQEIPVDNKISFNVIMKEVSIGLDEVIAIGYGTVKKQDLTGSISRVTSDAFENRSITTLGEGLSGKLAGVSTQQGTGGRPGDELSIKIRGIQSITASNAPLYVIDGVPGELSGLNPNDISSIEILKDASSAAIYGARGGAGVVMVTTKKGNKGKPTINYNMSYGLQEVDRLMPMMRRDEYIAWMIYSRNQGHLLQGGSLSDPMDKRGAYGWPLEWMNPSSLPDTDWQNEILQTAPIQNYQISASGGGESGNYYISGSFMNQDGIMKETDYQRATFRMNTSLNIGEKVKVGMNIAPSFSTSNNPLNDVKGVNLNAAVMPSIVGLDMNTEKWGYTDGAYPYPNPLETLKEVLQKNKTNRVNSNIWGELMILKDLVFKSQFGFNFVNYHNSFFQPSNVNNGRDTNANSSSNESYFWTLQNTIEYTPKVSSYFDMNLLLGQGTEKSKSYYLSGRVNGFANDLVHTMNVATTPLSASSSESEHSLNSFFGRLLINGLDKYLLTLNLRHDGSSRFGKDTKWGWFPSASMGWKLNNENFMESTSDWLNLLKVRVMYGVAGNNAIGNYESIPTLESANYTLNGSIVSGLAAAIYGNTNLGWETKTSKGVGVDFVAFNNRIQANLDFYLDNISDMLLAAPLSYMSGFSSVRQNLGEVRNKGWEFELYTRNLTGKFDWSTSINLSKNINEVISLGLDDTPIITIYGGSTTNITTVGEPIGSYYMYKTDGLLLDEDFDANGEPLVPILAGAIKGNVKVVDINGDGKINADDNTIVGNNQPDLVWGFTNNFNFKNFELNVFLQGAYGNDLFFSGARHMDLGQSTNGFNQFRRWLRSYKIDDYTEQENPFPQHMSHIDMSWDGKTPTRFGNNPIHNDTWIYDASYVRLKSVTLSYTLPKHITNPIGINFFKAFISGENLYTWTKYPGNSPESNSMGNETTQLGSDYGTYPMARTYTIGVNLNF